MDVLAWNIKRFQVSIRSKKPSTQDGPTAPKIVSHGCDTIWIRAHRGNSPMSKNFGSVTAPASRSASAISDAIPINNFRNIGHASGAFPLITIVVPFPVGRLAQFSLISAEKTGLLLSSNLFMRSRRFSLLYVYCVEDTGQLPLSSLVERTVNSMGQRTRARPI